MRIVVALALVALAVSPCAEAKVKRDAHQRALFMRSHPCPSTRKTRGACPGYVVDHVQPLCAGGPDEAQNMQWQLRGEALIKDADERRVCAALRHAHSLP